MQATDSAPFSLNGTPAVTVPAQPPAPRARRSRPRRSSAEPSRFAVNLARFKLGMTVVLGVGIPLLSLAMSKLAGTLAAGGMFALAVFALGLMVAVLGVSLSHLAWAVGDITRSKRAPSWALAIALDLSLVLCELVHVYAAKMGLTWLCFLMVVFVASCSMALNVYAFLVMRHGRRG